MSTISSLGYSPSPILPFISAASLKSESLPSCHALLTEILLCSKPGSMTVSEVAQEIKIIFETIKKGMIGTYSEPCVVKSSTYNEERAESEHLPRSFILFKDPAHAYTPCAIILLNRRQDGYAFEHGLSTTRQYKEGRLFYPLSSRSVEKVIVVTQDKTEESLNEARAHIFFRESSFIARLRTSYVHRTTYYYRSGITDTITKSYVHVRERVVQIFDFYPQLDLYERFRAYMITRNDLSFRLSCTTLSKSNQLQLARIYDEEMRKCLILTCTSLVYTARALVEMHRAGFAHRNIKPENILGQSVSVWKLGGLRFALNSEASSVSDTYFEPQGTTPFVSPEKATWCKKSLKERKKIPIDHLAADIWALGVTALDTFTEQDLPWIRSAEESEQLEVISSLTQEHINAYIESIFGGVISGEPFKEVLLALLIVDPVKRPTALQAEVILSKLCEKFVGEEIFETIPPLLTKREVLTLDDDDDDL